MKYVLIVLVVFLTSLGNAQEIEFNKCFDTSCTSEKKFISYEDLLYKKNTQGFSYQPYYYSCLTLPYNRKKMIETKDTVEFSRGIIKNLERGGSYIWDKKPFCEVIIDQPNREKLIVCADKYWKNRRQECFDENNIFVFKPTKKFNFKKCHNESLEIKTTIFSIGEPLQCSSLNEYNPLWKDRWKYGEDGKKYEYINYDDYKNNTPLNVANKQEDKDNEVQSQLPKCKIVDQKVITKTACYGTIIYRDGSKYVGEFMDGKEHGQGTHAWGNGDKYVGEYKFGFKDGQGTYTYRNGSKYVGEFKSSMKYGQGTYNHANGDKYVGEFYLGREGGQEGGLGTLTYANGDKYVGEFYFGNFNGQGTYTYADGRIESGEWKNGKLVRESDITPEEDKKLTIEPFSKPEF